MGNNKLKKFYLKDVSNIELSGETFEIDEKVGITLNQKLVLTIGTEYCIISSIFLSKNKLQRKKMDKVNEKVKTIINIGWIFINDNGDELDNGELGEIEIKAPKITEDNYYEILSDIFDSDDFDSKLKRIVIDEAEFDQKYYIQIVVYDLKQGDLILDHDFSEWDDCDLRTFFGTCADTRYEFNLDDNYEWKLVGM